VCEVRWPWPWGFWRRMMVLKMIVMMEKKFDGGDGEGMKVIEVRGETWMVCMMKLSWPPLL